MPLSVNAQASLTARMTVRAVTKVGVSDPAVCEWKCRQIGRASCRERVRVKPKLRTEAPVNGGRNYNGPKVAKFLVR